MLMIGAAGRNVGKTEFACSLIKRFKKNGPIIGVIVTTIADERGKCPRGGEGCGVCSSLLTEYSATEEINPPPAKHTGRLLQAGANKVYWLRVMKAHLEEGFKPLLQRIGTDSVVVCESNSLRLVVQPDLFVMVRDERARVYKPSAEAVRKYADKTVLFDGQGLDTKAGAFDLVDGLWTQREPATAIILVGGQSRRMGRDKSLLPIHGQAMLDHICNQLRPHFDEILLSTKEDPQHVPRGVRVVPDLEPGQGPLMGIFSCLQASVHDLNFVVACDMPVIDIALVKRMLAEARDYQGVVPVHDGNLTEPLFAVYRKSVLDTASRFLKSGRRRMTGFCAECNILFVDGGFGAKGLTNLNTPEEYERFRGGVDEPVCDEPES